MLLPPGDGETITDEPARFVQIKVGLEQLALTDNRYGHGESGPDTHVHREHADCFVVLDGELVLEVGAEGGRVEAPAGTFVMVPPELAHTFRNEGDADARFLNIHAPSKGFADHLRDGGDGGDFDTFEPPGGGGLPASALVVRGPGEGDALALGPSQAVIKSSAQDGLGSLTLMDNTIAAGFPGPIPHRHRRMVDSFYVLDGTLTLLAGEEPVDAAAGTFAAMPPGARHTFSNPSADPVRVLNVMAPGGFESYLREFAAVAGANPGAPPDPEAMARIAAKYDFEPAP